MVRKSALSVHYDEASGTATIVFEGCIMRIPGFFDSTAAAVTAGERLYRSITGDRLHPLIASAGDLGTDSDGDPDEPMAKRVLH